MSGSHEVVVHLQGVGDVPKQLVVKALHEADPAWDLDHGLVWNSRSGAEYWAKEVRFTLEQFFDAPFTVLVYVKAVNA
jgi:hypothetical protein